MSSKNVAKDERSRNKMTKNGPTNWSFQSTRYTCLCRSVISRIPTTRHTSPKMKEARAILDRKWPGPMATPLSAPWILP